MTYEYVLWYVPKSIVPQSGAQYLSKEKSRTVIFYFPLTNTNVQLHRSVDCCYYTPTHSFVSPTNRKRHASPECSPGSKPIYIEVLFCARQAPPTTLPEQSSQPPLSPLKASTRRPASSTQLGFSVVLSSTRSTLHQLSATAVPASAINMVRMTSASSALLLAFSVSSLFNAHGVLEYKVRPAYHPNFGF